MDPAVRPWGEGVLRVLAWSLALLATLALGIVLVLLTDNVLVSAVWRYYTWAAPVVFASSILVTVTAWGVVNTKPQTTVGLALIQLALLGPVAAAWTQVGAPVRGAMISLAPLSIAGAAQVGLSWSPRVRHPLVLSVVYGFAVVAAVALFAGFNPFEEPRCGFVCPYIRPPLAELLTSRSSLGFAAASAGTAAVLAVATLARRSKALPRPVLFAAALAAGSMWAPTALRWVQWSETPAPTIGWLPFITALILSCSVVLTTLGEQHTKRAMRALVDYVSDPISSLSNANSHAASAQFFIPETRRWVDAMGRAVSEPGDRAHVVSDSAGPMVRLFLQAGEESAGATDALTPGLKLALKTAQMKAISRANLAQVEASRRRIVSSSDSERRRIERDLHDGAQQRLIGVMFYLSLARAQQGTPEGELAQVENDVSTAIEQLRSLAHGVFPSLLSQEGLWAALDELCRVSPKKAELEVSGVDDVALEPAMAAYALVSRAMQMVAPDSEQEKVSVRCNVGERLHIKLEIPHAGWIEADWIDVVDRIGAVGGVLDQSSVSGCLLIEADLPCV